MVPEADREDPERTVRSIAGRIGPPSPEHAAAAQARMDDLTKPQGSLGRLEEIARRIVAIRQDQEPRLRQKAIVVFAADHGVVVEGVSAYPRAVTAQMVANFLKGGAAINALARHAGARVVVVDIGVDHDFGRAEGLIQEKVRRGTANMAMGPALTREEAARAVVIGIEMALGLAAEGVDLLGAGDMGIGNTTAASAVVAAFTGAAPEAVTGRGTGVDDAGLARKVGAIRRALAVNRPDAGDPLDVLAKVGGLEIGGIAGLILGGAAARLPVVVDGFVSAAAALTAVGLAPLAREYLFSAHRSAEPGHQVVIDHLGQPPLLDLGMRLGEGTGAVLAMGLIEAALKAYLEMATFSEAQVSTRGGGA